MVHLFAWIVSLFFGSAEASAVSTADLSLPPGGCPFGCIASPSGVVYAVQANDVVWLAKVLKAESGPRFVEKETAATGWALVQSYAARLDRHGVQFLTLAEWVTNYSAACSKRWATGGRSYHPRITPRADRCRAALFDDLPRVWRDVTVDLLRGLIPCRTRGLVHVLARGFEASAAPDLIGPYYATTTTEHPGGNAYYATAESIVWPYGAVRLVPASLSNRVILSLASLSPQ